MPIQLVVPSVGESITEVQIGQWRKPPGAWAHKDEPLVEIETDKATVELSAPASGVITEVLKREGEQATVGEVIGYFEERSQPEPAADAVPAPNAPPATGPVAQPRVMPAAQRLLAEHHLSASEVTPTGPGGRILKEDVQREAERRPAASPPPAAGPPTSRPERDAAPPAVPAAAAGRVERVVPMSLIRRRIAARLVEAQQTAALLTTFNEIDMSAVIGLRTSHREALQTRHGVKLGFMSFFVKATIDALRHFPALNAEIRGQEIAFRDYQDIGVAVGGGKGLVVPVLRDAQAMSFAQIELAIADLAGRAAQNKLEPAELEGGTFTISNGGVYGSLLSTPIVNPPQSGILGLHAIEDRPVARDGQVVIRPMMYVALTYDHRLVDGREAVTFLRRVKEVVEDPARLLLEI